MNFYKNWAETIRNDLDDSGYIKDFLNCENDTVDCLLNGEKDEVVFAIQVLLSVPMERFIFAIDHDYDFASKDVFQYSKLEDATVTLCNLLEYEYPTLNFMDAGSKLAHAQNEYACIKYGENHIKLANALSLVKIEKFLGRKMCEASITSLGSISTAMSSRDRDELINRLAIRNSFVKALIFYAKNGNVEYKTLVSKVLSGQTIIRRKHNVEIIVTRILENHPICKNIRW